MTATTMTARRLLGNSGMTASAMGLGTWAIGGPFWAGSQPLGWGEVDDEESIRAIHRALDLGVTFFDTADVYGCGRAERVLGRALAGVRERVVIGTKFGNTFDEATLQLTGSDASPVYVRQAAEASLRRLGVDVIDLFLLHLSDLPIKEASPIREALDDLVAAGLIRAYAWSTDDPERARSWAGERHCVAVQHQLNILADAGAMLELCDDVDVASINRSPLAMGLLSGKFGARSRLAHEDVRGQAPEWLTWFRDGRPAPEFLARIAAVREILTSGGRTLAQGAIGWNWARSPRTIPIPGFRTVAQVEENAGALRFGPLTAEQMAEIAVLLRQDDDAVAA